MSDDDNVTHIITAETVGMDQLAGFDSVGQAGPGVTFEIACREVKRLTAEVSELRKMFRWLAGRYSTHTSHCQLQEYLHPHEFENLARNAVSDSQELNWENGWYCDTCDYTNYTHHCACGQRYIPDEREQPT